MASIKTALTLQDGMSKTLQRIVKAMNIMISEFEMSQKASGRAFDEKQIKSMRHELGLANSELNDQISQYERLIKKQSDFNSKLSQGQGMAGGLLNKITGFVGAYIGVQSAGKLISMSDQMTGNEARLSLIVGDNGSVDELKQKIYAAAQDSRGLYTDMMSTVAKLGLTAGDAFKDVNGQIDTDQMIKFTELLNKNFIISGASATEQASAMYQLTQALASGRLQGDEYRSIIENAPLLASAIEDYMRNVKGAQGSMKDWASEGLLTADVIKAAVFTSADEVESRFNQMPMTWGQIWNEIQNYAVGALDPVLEKLNAMANSGELQTMIEGLVNVFVMVANVIMFVANAVSWLINLFSGSMPFLTWLVLTLAGAFLVYKGVMLAASVATAMQTAQENRLAAAEAKKAGATFLATVAQYGLNAATYAFPGTWLIMLVIGIIVALAALAAVIFGFEFDTSGLTNPMGNTQMSSYEDYLNQTLGADQETAYNTGEMMQSSGKSTEELKYLRDIAEKEAINRFTTAEIHIDMSGMQNTVNNTTDLDGVIEYFSDALVEAVEVSAEGVHV